MSADNYILIRRVGTMWTWTEESASADVPSRLNGTETLYDVKDRAELDALRYSERSYVEYGVFFEDDLDELRRLKEEDSQAVKDVVAALLNGDSLGTYG